MFESTERRLIELSLGSNWAHGDLENTWEEGRLADDLPGLIVANADQIPGDMLREVYKDQLEDSRTGLFDTHPCSRDRIARVSRRAESPLFRLDQAHAALQGVWSCGRTLPGPSRGKWPSADVVFRNFEALSRRSSMAYYRQRLGDRVTDVNLVSVKTLVQKQSAESLAAEAFRRFFLGQFGPDRPLGLRPARRLAEFDPLKRRQQVIQWRQSVRSAAQGYGTTLKTYYELEDRIAVTARCKALIEAGIRISPEKFGLTAHTPEALERIRRQASLKQKAVCKKLEDFEMLNCRRILAAVEFLSLPGLAAKLPGSEGMLAEAWKLLPLGAVLETQFTCVGSLKLCYHELVILGHQLSEDRNSEPLLENLRIKATDIRMTLMQLQGNLSHLSYPFDHVNPKLSLGNFLIEEIPDVEDLQAVIDATYVCVDRIFRLYARIISRLASVAEAVEQALGLPPLAGSQGKAVDPPESSVYKPRKS